MQHGPAQPDAALVEASLAGDQRAFATLVQRYAQPLTALIRYRVADAAHAEDVWQETLLAAWRSLAQLRDAGRARAWLMGVARNQCRLHHRSAQRRDVPMPDDEIAGLLNRFGPADASRRAAIGAAMEAVAAARPADREVLRAFYIDGFTISEIAARRDIPVGTAKRRLHTARQKLRETMGTAPATRRTSMTAMTQADDRAAFPAKRPAIEIRALAESPPQVDCRELRWWYIVPTLGEAASFAAYEAPDWTLGTIATLSAAASAKVHDATGVRIDVAECRSGEPVQDGIRTMFGRLSEREAEWLATIERDDGDERLRTYLDPHWAEDWGAVPRRLGDAGAFQERSSGVLETPGDDTLCGVRGVFDVRIGGRRLRCVRVLDLDLLGRPARDEAGLLIEAYLSFDGRTVLCRRYNARRWRGEDVPWDQRLPASASLVIDGATYVHWYDHVVSQTRPRVAVP